MYETLNLSLVVYIITIALFLIDDYWFTELEVHYGVTVLVVCMWLERGEIANIFRF